MYISIEQSHALDKAIKDFEVALRSCIASVLLSKYPDAATLAKALNSISLPHEFIYSRRFATKRRNMVDNVSATHRVIVNCNQAFITAKFNNDVPYVSELIDFVLLFFDAHFSSMNFTKRFSSVEEFHYCCTLYHRTRNNLSHPGSRPTTEADAHKVLFFIENLISSLDNKYFWYRSKDDIKKSIQEYRLHKAGLVLKKHNLHTTGTTHKNLLCRDTEVAELYSSIAGTDDRRRLAGSVVLYGYGGVGKTAITAEFLQRLLRDKKDGKYPDIEYLLFFSSKDEYLRDNKTTGELYIDDVRPEFSTLAELEKQICTCLNITDIGRIEEHYKRGIITIDNIENIEASEKTKIVSFIKSLPRSVQFIVTSRSEETCEEKIHIEEFKDEKIGISFIEGIIDAEGFNVDFNESMMRTLLAATKGNALIIIQLLNIISRDVSTFDEAIKSLESLKSKNSEMIANFMYKNTFDNALLELSKKGYPAKEVIQIISLYGEPIELYSIGKLAKIDISVAESLCNTLLQRLVLVKTGEYYELNDFAKRFVFIKLLPDRIELAKIKDKIGKHKDRMKAKLGALDTTLNENAILRKIVTEWQPKNYIDKIIIAELFSLYGEAASKVRDRNRTAYEGYIKELNDHSFITNHPYVAFQKARILKLGAFKFYRNDTNILNQIAQAYEDAIESIEYDYRYLLGSSAHSSLIMLFGIFLVSELKDHGRAVRYLEDAKKGLDSDFNKTWFICCNYLSKAYYEIFKLTNDKAYKDQLSKVYRQVLAAEHTMGKGGIDINRYKQEFSRLI